MGERWLPIWMRCRVVSQMSFTDNSGFHYFNQAWLRKSKDIEGQEREYKLK